MTPFHREESTLIKYRESQRYFTLQSLKKTIIIFTVVIFPFHSDTADYVSDDHHCEPDRRQAITNVFTVVGQELCLPFY